MRRRVRSEGFTSLLAILESATEPRVQFDFVTMTRGLDYVAEARTDASDWQLRGSQVRPMKRAKYDKELHKLQVQLCHLQAWVKAKGLRVVIVFEGRDGAGKGGTIRAITERLSPRVFRVAALPAPSDREKSQVYMQRYLQHFPAAGEVVIFDRSWYNRAGVEYVMGFCTPKEHERFLEVCPEIEKFLVDGGVILIKLWLEVSNDEQKRRFEARISDPAAPVEAESDGSPVAPTLVRLLARARHDAETDRYPHRPVAHRPV